MKYCIDFYGEYNLPLLESIDEININISKLAHPEDLVEFCDIHNKQRINLCIEDYTDKPDLVYFAFDFQRDHQEFNVGIRLPYYEERIYEELKKTYPEMKIFFKTGVNDWELLQGFLKLGVTDLYIVENLGFELDAVAEIAHKVGVQTRVFPNIAQASWKTTDDMVKFWIRPEDIEFYEDFVDICEFFYERPDQQLVYYDIYAIDGKWNGDLSEIIIGLEKHIDSRRLLPTFAIRRPHCDRRCMKGGPCALCFAMEQLSYTLEEKDLIIENEKEKKERTIANG